MKTESRTRSRRRLLAAAALLPLAARAAPPARNYAVMSLVGDRLQVVGQESTTGTLLDQKPREIIEMQGDELDRAVLRTAVAAIKRAEPVSRAAPIRVNEPRYYAGQGGWISGNRATLPPEVADALRGALMSHLLLVTKHRARANLRGNTDVAQGMGNLEGLGFYIDRESSWRLKGSGDVSRGFLAPYFHARAQLVDLATMDVLQAVTIAEGEVITASGTQKGDDPWSLLDSQGKIRTLVRMVEEQIDVAVPKLLAP